MNLGKLPDESTHMDSDIESEGMLREPNLQEFKITRREIPSNEVGNNILDAAIIEIEKPNLKNIFLVVKKTPYVENPADLMLMIGNRKISQLTEFSDEQGVSFFDTCGKVVESMKELTQKGVPVIALNQQLESTQIPEKYSPDGTELKVQTIDAIHAHLFIEMGEGSFYKNFADLEEQDKVDFADPFGFAIGKVVYQDLRDLHIQGVEYSTSEPPFGLTLNFKGSVPEVLADPKFFRTLKYVQSQYNERYLETRRSLMNEDGTLKPRSERLEYARGVLGKYTLSEYEIRQLLILGVASRESEFEERKYMRFVQGPAITWTIYEKNKSVKAHMSFRVVSRGNATDTLGIWADPTGTADKNRQENLFKFYKDLLTHLRVNMGGLVRSKTFLENE